MSKENLDALVSIGIAFGIMAFMISPVMVALIYYGHTLYATILWVVYVFLSLTLASKMAEK